MWALSEENLRRNARALGTLPYAVCRDGRVLAGEWSGPDPVQMEQEAAVNSEDWARRMELVIAKLHYRSSPQSRPFRKARTWARSAANCIMLLLNSANAAELLVKATDGTPRRARPTAAMTSPDWPPAFSTQRPGRSTLALANRMAAPEQHEAAPTISPMYEFQPPEPTRCECRHQAACRYT